MRDTLPGLCSALMLSACVTALTQGGSSVRVTSNPDVVSECEFLGEVQGSSQTGGALAGRGDRDAMNEVRNAAAELGGNVVFLMTSSAGFTGARSRGEAYKCETTPPER